MSTRHSVRARGVCVASLLLAAAVEPVSARVSDFEEERERHDVVAVAVVDGGRAIVLATPGVPHRGRRWRFRSLDTSELTQPIVHVTLAASGSKLFIQGGSERGGVLDLTRQDRHNTALQYVAPEDLATGGDSPRSSHRLLQQRFVSLSGGIAYLMDDHGRVQAEYAAPDAVRAAIAEDGAIIYARADGGLAICGEPSNGGTCRDLVTRVGGTVRSISARSVRVAGANGAPRFLVLNGEGERAHALDPEHETPSQWSSPLESGLRAALAVNGWSMADRTAKTLVDALLRESSDVSSAGGRITDWQFFPVSADAELYAPVLQFAPSETVFPAPFDALEQLSRQVPARTPPTVRALYDRYMRSDRNARLDRCTYYFHTMSAEGSWLIEYWLYYPFDIGGLGSHPHDPEHIFVEVDKLGGAPWRVIGAGHGYMAGNNIYSADKRGAPALRLPLFAMVELGKHATAPDIDHDGMFTPGVDENEYRERAKIWGVRDAIGTINNEFLAYDRTMTVARRPHDAVALASAKTVFGGDPDFVARPSCKLEPLEPGKPARRRSTFRVSDWVLLPPCHTFSRDCAKLHVTAHPDFLEPRTVLKEWAFPAAFLRATTGVGPRRGFRTAGLSYVVDMAKFPALGRILPLPGRLGVEGFYWRQNVDDPDRNSCLADCKRRSAVGWGLRYDTFISNLFGVYSATRVYTAPVSDLWVTFGPFVEAPLGRRSNISAEGGLAFRPTESPRFEFRINVGLWKPKTRNVGMRAGTDRAE